MDISKNSDPIYDVVELLEDHNTEIPDIVASAICSQAGFKTNDHQILQLISTASEQFIAGISNDALQHFNGRTAKKNGIPKEKKKLCMKDLSPVLNDR